jgi:hypothetical protein
MIFVTAGGYVRLGSKKDEFKGKLRPMFVEKFTLGKISLESPTAITKPKLEKDFHKGSKWTVFIDGHTNSADTGISLSEQTSSILLVTCGNVPCIGLSGSK